MSASIARFSNFANGPFPKGFSVLLAVVAIATCKTTNCVAQSRTHQSRIYQSQRQIEALGLTNAWRTQLSTGAIERDTHLSMHVSPTKVRKIYDVIEQGHRTSFAGPTAAHDADIRLRTILMSDREATLEVRDVPLVTLYVQTGSGRLESIDAETGQRHWSIRIGSTGAPAYTPMADDDHVVAISGATIYVISAKTGKLIFDRPMTGVAVAGPTLVGTSVLIPTQRKDFQVYSLTEETRRFVPSGMTSFGTVIDQPRVTEAGVAWTSDRGMFLGDPETRRSKFRVEPRGAMIGAPSFSAPDRFMVTLAQGYVLAVDARRGQTVWEFGAGEPLASATYVAGDTVYVGSADRNLFAIDTELGSQRWVAAGVNEIVCHGDKTLYGTTADRRLVALDATSGAMRGRVALAAGDRVIPNHQTDRIYLLSNSGRLRCLRRVDAPWPTIHQELPAKPAMEEKAESIETEPADEPPTEDTELPTSEVDAAEEDPFASGDEGEDPFATGDEGEDPFGSGDEEEEDPFGF